MQDKISLIYDFIGVGLILISVVLGFARGFFKNLICLFGNIAAFVGALIFSSFFATTIYETFLEKILSRKLDKIIGNIAKESIVSIENYIKELPDYIQNAANLAGIKTQEIVDDAAMVSIEKSLMVNLVKPVVTLFISIVLFFICFCILKFFVRGIASLFGHVNEIPVLGLANRIAGGALGFVGGVMYTYIFVLLLKFIILFTGGTSDLFSLSVINDTTLIKMLFYFKFH